jgi:hypothetical protein
VVALSTGDVTSGVKRPLAVEIDIPSEWYIQKMGIVVLLVGPGQFTWRLDLLSAWTRAAAPGCGRGLPGCGCGGLPGGRGRGLPGWTAWMSARAAWNLLAAI